MIVVAALVAGGADDGVRTADDRVQEIAAGLRCPVCQNLSVADSPSRLAGEMRAEIADLLAAGQTPEQIRAYFVDRYGEWVLLAPTKEGLNLLPWAVPIVGPRRGGGVGLAGPLATGPRRPAVEAGDPVGGRPEPRPRGVGGRRARDAGRRWWLATGRDPRRSNSTTCPGRAARAPSLARISRTPTPQERSTMTSTFRLREATDARMARVERALERREHSPSPRSASRRGPRPRRCVE